MWRRKITLMINAIMHLSDHMKMHLTYETYFDIYRKIIYPLLNSEELIKILLLITQLHLEECQAVINNKL